MLPPSDAFNIEHAQALLDVVVGVVIAMPLAALPATIESLFASGKTASTDRRHVVVDLLLTAAALIFVTFYWLETRQFVSNQTAFAKALSDTQRTIGVVTLPRATFVLGILGMVVGAACTLAWSTFVHFRYFLITNACFWFFDFGGTVALKRSYLPLRGAFQAARVAHPHEWQNVGMWYDRHIVSNVHYFYGPINAAVFIFFFIIDRKLQGREGPRIVMAAVLLGLTLIRHTLV